MVTVAVRVPVAEGLKITFKRQVPPPATVLLQAFVWLKSAAAAPENVMEVIETATEPGLLSVSPLIKAVLSGVFANVSGLGLAFKVAGLTSAPVPTKFRT